MYNPYELVKISLNGHETYGRPVGFDSDPIDLNTMKNAFGKYIKPNCISSTCPDCGQGFILNIKLPDPPFDIYECVCPLCKTAPEPLLDPFVNPVGHCKISLNELDPILHDLSSEVISDTTVLERSGIIVNDNVASEYDTLISQLDNLESSISSKPEASSELKDPPELKVSPKTKSSSKSKKKQSKSTINADTTSADKSELNIGFIEYPTKKRKLPSAEDMGGDEVDF